ncbi:hypothetical protein NHX12_001304 [Muraenolepis orangiensis]|uniref:Uncharacterized protein n=1 Tax=Muraenolepis orangiensis TaxID=630683 RepID=A0A9Q0DZL8_9TELE|nr:hypothetical protein NHX12_001304 [Muraenolepis orangiensis]
MVYCAADCSEQTGAFCWTKDELQREREREREREGKKAGGERDYEMLDWEHPIKSSWRTVSADQGKACLMKRMGLRNTTGDREQPGLASSQ